MSATSLTIIALSLWAVTTGCVLFVLWRLWWGLSAATRAVSVLGQEHEAHQRWTGLLSTRLTLVDQEDRFRPSPDLAPPSRFHQSLSQTDHSPSQSGEDAPLQLSPEPLQGLRRVSTHSWLQMSLTPPLLSSSQCPSLTDLDLPSPSGHLRRFHSLTLADRSQSPPSVTSQSPIHWESVLSLAGRVVLPTQNELSALEYPPLTSNNQQLLPRYCPLGVEIPPPCPDWLASRGLLQSSNQEIIPGCQEMNPASRV